jgi:sugar/nucleoside kinase (ribokinase family)
LTGTPPRQDSSTASIEIVGIGVSVWDCVLLVDSMPQTGAVVRASQRVEGIGGGVTVAMATAARLGSSTAMIDSLGDDEASRRIIAALRRENVQTGYIAVHPGRSSSLASIWSQSDSAERTIVYSPGSACDSIRWTAEIEQCVARAKVVHLNGRHPVECARAIEVAKVHGVKVSFDGGAYRYRDEILPMLSAADIAIVARQFAESHFRKRTGSREPIRTGELAAFLMADLNCELVGVTDGARGSVLVRGDAALRFQPALDVDHAVDTTGCGDTYHGAFLHAYAGGQAFEDAARLAAKVAAANAQGIGALAFDAAAIKLT